MIRIAFIIDTIATPSAGTEKQLLMLLHGLNREEFEPHFLCLRPSSWLDEQHFSFPHKVFKVTGLKSPQTFKELGRIIRYLKEHKIQIVQTFFRDGNAFGTYVGHRAGCKVVSSRRNIGYWHNGIQLKMLRFFRRWTDWYLANSQAVIDVTVRDEYADRKKIHLVYNGLELKRFAEITSEMRTQQRNAWGVAADETLIGTVANLRPVKNLPSFVKAAASLAKEFPKAKFVAVGEGDQREKLEQLIEAAGLTGRFLLPGRADDIIPPLAAMDVAVMCSSSESFSNSLIEFMAAGKPIVASAVGGNVEAIAEGESGLLYDPKEPGALTGAIRRMLQNPEKARQMAEAAQAKALRKYSREESIRQHEDFYRKLAGGESDGAGQSDDHHRHGGFSVRKLVKQLAIAFFWIITAPLGLSSLLVRKLFGSAILYDICAEYMALWPGKIGKYFRLTFYQQTLAECGFDHEFCHLVVISKMGARLKPGVMIGAKTAIGQANIGEHTVIANFVSILSGRRQHNFDDPEKKVIEGDTFADVNIGRNCFIGEGSIVMADIGDCCIIGAGSVVVKPIPDYSVAVGNPAKVVKSRPRNGESNGK